jgi:hypothetical protein
MKPFDPHLHQPERRALTEGQVVWLTVAGCALVALFAGIVLHAANVPWYLLD